MNCFITKYNVDCPDGTDSVVLEDSIMHKGRHVTAGSKMLANFVSPIDATVVKKLEAAGVRILGKTKMTEFGIGGLFATSSATQPPHHPSLQAPEAIQPPRPLSLSGAVTAVADGVANFALCNDYTGAISQEAAMHGLCYIHPTYGTVSRYGLIPTVTSMDQIGVVCKTPEEGFRALAIITGYDEKDGAMLPKMGEEIGAERGEVRVDTGDAANSGLPTHRHNEAKDATMQSKPQSDSLRIGVPVNVMTRFQNDTPIAVFTKAFTTVDFELQHFEIYQQIMQILCCAELSNNISRYDGIKYGHRAGDYNGLRELYTKSRTEAFGADVKLAAMIGAMVLSQENFTRYYDKAMRIRRLIKESLDFDKYDAIIAPTCLAALPLLCGLPAVTVPLHGGVTLIANARREDVLQSILKVVGI